MRAGGDETFADGAGPVLGRDRHLPCDPVLADPGQRGRDDPLAQVSQRHSAGEPGDKVPRQGLVARHDRGVQPVRLRIPVPDPDLRTRCGARGPALGQGGNVIIADLVTPAGLPGWENSLANPAVGRLVVHPEDDGGLSQLHDRLPVGSALDLVSLRF
jgi:hypothetical protein